MCHLRSGFCFLATTTTVLGTKTFLKLNFKKSVHLNTNIHGQETKYRNQITYRAKFLITEQCKETRLLRFAVFHWLQN